MSDNSSGPYSELTQADKQKVRYARRLDQDSEFEILVDNANRQNAEHPITLSLPGGMVTGVLIGAQEYFRLKAAQLEQAADPDVEPDVVAEAVESVEEHGKEIRENAIEEFERFEEEEETIWRGPNYYHLKEAQFVFGDYFSPSTSGMLWRGKIADVNGYSEAKLSREVS